MKINKGVVFFTSVCLVIIVAIVLCFNYPAGWIISQIVTIMALFLSLGIMMVLAVFFGKRPQEYDRIVEVIKDIVGDSAGRPRLDADERARALYHYERMNFDEVYDLWVKEAQEERPDRQWIDSRKSLREILRRKPKNTDSKTSKLN